MKTRPEPGIEVKDIPIPKINDDEVLIKVKASAICGSDLGIYHYTPAYNKMKLPVVMGHEFAGQITKLGKNVKDYKTGDRVLSESVKACKTCQYCLEGRSNLCDSSTLFGIHTDGGFAEYIAVPYKLLHPIPDSMTYEQASLVEPLSNTLHFVKDITPIKIGDLAIVQGCGPIGLFSAQLLRLAGAKVLMTGISQDKVRFQIARKLGFEIINVEDVDLVQRVRDITAGKGADIGFVAVGAPSAMRQATEYVKKRGHVTVVGIFGKEVALDMTWIVRNEIVINGAYDAKPVNFPQSIQLITDGLINVKDLLTHRFRLEDAEEAFNVALNKTGGKVIFTP